jgi:hypothetical protein
MLAHRARGDLFDSGVVCYFRDVPQEMLTNARIVAGNN